MTSGEAEDAFTHDAAGNLTYDGCFKYKYDPDSRENRLVKVKRACRDCGSTLPTTSAAATITYDGLGRRVKKVITNSGDLPARGQAGTGGMIVATMANAEEGAESNMVSPESRSVAVSSRHPSVRKS